MLFPFLNTLGNTFSLHRSSNLLIFVQMYLAVEIYLISFQNELNPDLSFLATNNKSNFCTFLPNLISSNSKEISVFDLILFEKVSTHVA